jgi:subtilisin family serine protease
MADSIGADVINSSLGYYNYDAPYQALSYNQLDGKTTPIARAANTAGLLGMLVVVSAGNEALTDWKHIITPADAHECIAVGAVNRKEELAAFSSLGPTYDGRIKPDVVALGEGTVVHTPSGEIGAVDGTSISAPIVSGFAACLWQALPHLTAKELAHIMLQSGSRSSKPNNSMGYGIPDFSKAIKLSKEM